MKNILIPVLLIAAIAAGTIVHLKKNKPDAADDYVKAIDELAVSLKGMEAAVSPASRLSARFYGNSPVPVYLLARYVLAYPYGISDSKNNLDTVLNICSPDAGDSVIRSISKGRKVIWSREDEKYKYFLTCSLK